MWRNSYDRVIGQQPRHSGKAASALRQRLKGAESQSLLARSRRQLDIKGSAFATLRDKTPDALLLAIEKCEFVEAPKGMGARLVPGAPGARMFRKTCEVILPTTGPMSRLLVNPRRLDL